MNNNRNKQLEVIEQLIEKLDDLGSNRSAELGSGGIPEADLIREMSAINNVFANMQRELAKKTAELENLNRFKDQVLGMAAHDLRNPLMLIQNFADFLIEDLDEQQVLTDDRRELLEEIRSSSRYMVTTIEGMLDLSSIETGNITLSETVTNLNLLLKQTVKLNRNSADQKKVAITLDLPDPPVRKEVDMQKMKQVLDNLLSNAVKFSDPGSPVEAGIHDKGEGRVVFFVRDRGPGIAEEDLDQIFTPFARLDAKPTGGEKSTGLGLAIARKIVEAHGGTIRVESEYGEGSVFWVELP